MSLRPGDLLGLPDGFPSANLDAGWLRVVLVALALAVAWAIARGRPRIALAAALAWAVFATAFWSLAMARPYGLLQERAVTAWAADVGVAAAGSDGGFLAGEPPASPRWSAFARRAGARATLLLPTAAAILTLPAAAVLIALLWGRSHAMLAAILWLGASAIELDVGRGTAVPVALLARPALGLALAAGLAAALVLGRLVTRASVAMGMAAAAALVAAGWTRGSALALTDLPGALAVDAIAWLALAVAGTAIRRDPAACGLAAGGAAGLVLSLSGAVDATAAAAFYRAGLVLAALPAIAAGAERLAGVLALPLGRARVLRPNAAGLLAAVAGIALAGGFLTWWDPARLDPAMRASLEPIGGGAAEAADWIRAATDPDDAFVAGEDYAPAVAVLAGRRVLRAPTLAMPADDVRRLRAERAILLGRGASAQVKRYRLRYLLVAAGQFRHQGLPEPWPAETALTLRYDARGIRIYELPTAGPDGHVDVDVDGEAPTK
jgi:hypothetical protein